MTALKNMAIGAGLLAAFLIVQRLDFEEEIRKEVAMVERCNAMGKPAFRDRDGQMRCAMNAPGWSFVSPVRPAQ